MNSTSVANHEAASTQIGHYRLHVPFPQELGVECEKAKEIINEFAKSFTDDNENQTIPPHAFVRAKGIVVISSLKVGAGWSGRVGSGLVVAKLADGRWSAPSAVVLFGAGYGPQIGASITDLIYVLTSDSAMTSFLQTGQLTVGAQFSLTAGNSSKAMESSAVFARGSGVSPVMPGYCYAKSKGFFIGVSLEGAMITTRRDANERFYHESGLTQAQLLGSVLEPAAAAEPMYLALNATHAAAVERIQKDAADALTNVQTVNASIPTIPTSPSSGKQPYAQPQPQLQPSAPPAGYEKSGYAPIIADGGSAAAAASGGTMYPTVPSLPNRDPEPEGEAEFEPIAIALYDYEAQRPTDLSFKKGDVIAIVSRSETTNDWWVGRLNGKEGRFPANRTKVETK